MSSSALLDGAADAAQAPEPGQADSWQSCSKLGRFNYHVFQAADRFLGHSLSATPGRYAGWARLLGFHSLDSSNTHKSLHRALSDSVFISNQHGSAELAALEAAGVTHIVVAGTGRNLGPWGLWPRFPQRFTYLHVELRDNETEEQAEAMRKAIGEAVPFIQGAVQTGGRVLIHWSVQLRSAHTALSRVYLVCQLMLILILWCSVRSPSSAGISRSASLVIAHALYAGLFDSFDEAYAALKASRAIVLPNPSFERILRAYAAEQKERRAGLAAAASVPSASPSLGSVDSDWSSGSLGSASELRSRSAVTEEGKEDGTNEGAN